MYDYIKGTLISKNEPYIVVEAGGIGYSILSNARTISFLPECNDGVKIYTKLIHKEDSMFLCGFMHKEDRVIFDILTYVSGIGTKVALTLLDEFQTSELIGAVIEGDYKYISRAKGVGPKLAQKIILELKDKLTAQSAAIVLPVNTQKRVQNETMIEVQTILSSLGYSQSEYSSAIEAVSAKIEKDDAQELLRLSLKVLSE